ncbi:MAG: PorT family protein [Bacteroidales bacterium]|nr:PorT family protein [Bacteroidales bacterium]
MKNLFKSLILLIILLPSQESFSQQLVARAGFNLACQSFSGYAVNSSRELKWKPGYSVGLASEIPITKAISFEPGISFSNKGYKLFEKQGLALDISDYNLNISLNYLEIPLYLKTSYTYGSVKMYGAAGPYLGVGLWGRQKADFLFRGQPRSDNSAISWGTDINTDTYRRIDWGINAGAGIEISSWQFGLSYSFGLANLSPDTSGNLKNKNKVIALNLGYKLGKK